MRFLAPGLGLERLPLREVWPTESSSRQLGPLVSGPWERLAWELQEPWEREPGPVRALRQPGVEPQPRASVPWAQAPGLLRRDEVEGRRARLLPLHRAWPLK